MIPSLITRVITAHPDFTHDEVAEVCQDYMDSMTSEKIKDETKIKRLMKYIEKEFELGESKIEKTSNKIYNLESVPEYLFSGESRIVSALVSITGLVKNIEQTELFADAEMQINRRDKVALIGKNGAGKTTLLKMIIGREGEYKGTIEKATGLKVGYLSQDLFWQDMSNTLRAEMLMVFPDITERIVRLTEIEWDDNQWEETDAIKTYLRDHDGYRRYDLQTEILRYFGFTDAMLDQHVLSLSGGEQTKVQIAKFLITEVDLLILDEPTNHLDIEGIIFLERFCKIWKKAILSISHDVRFIDNTSDRIVEISGKKLNNYQGKYADYLVEKQARYDRQLRAHTLQKKEIEEQEAWINRFRYTPSKSNSVQSRIKQVDKIERIDKPEGESTVRNITIKAGKRLPEKIMTITDLAVGYNTPIITTHGELIVRKDEKIGIIGRNGAGKTTLLKTILGELRALSGTVTTNPNLIIGSYSQVLADLDGSASIITELTRNSGNEGEIRAMLGGLLITGDKVDQTIATLSGGERAKVALTKMLLTHPHVIIMDEPTNHLDLHSKEVIKNMLEHFDGTSLIVSHDRDLLEHISNRVWLIQEGVLMTFDDPERGFVEVF
ncbi:ABC-F family ATP-binding cassette domain-containing protein [Candidatus Gracilibacteria bacterium]|nr:ABC-F family ATP-binding cassette domain-containing protein [Candidatus Gracilibacteria bacterium]